MDDNATQYYLYLNRQLADAERATRYDDSNPSTDPAHKAALFALYRARQAILAFHAEHGEL